MGRYDDIMEGAVLDAAYYRENPDRFAEDYLHIKLRLFQSILLVMMFHSTTFVFVACRGIGKTFLGAVYAVSRCILYPGTEVCVVSKTRGQAIQTLDKIEIELKPRSPELRLEIDEKESKRNGTDARIMFKNGSVIKVVTAGDSGRGHRGNVLLLDEYRLISKDAIDDILKKFLTKKREPRYEELSEKERLAELDKESNLKMYLSSAWFKDHWSYTTCLDTFENMLDDRRRQFVCGFPYELSLKEGLLDKAMVEDEMSETDFNEIKWMVEMEGLFYGSEDDAFFDFTSISKNRKIKYPMLPGKLAIKLNNASDVRIVPKQNGEIRILSADIALMSSKKHNNDATAIFINRMMPTKAGRYISNIVYGTNSEGLRTEEQALEIRKLYDEFECDYIVIDANGLGLGVFDCLARDIVDTESGEIYPALSCCNNTDMAARCTVPNAPKVIWAIKAGAQFNSDCAFLLREAFKSGRIRLLANEYDAEDYLGEIKGYSGLSPSDKVKLTLPYINTTLLVDELTKLQHEESNGKVKVYERSGMRKDRYSSLSYNYYVALQLENKESKKRGINSSTSDMFVVKPPAYNRNRKVVTTNGDNHSWRNW